jgi:hypothetical protein
MLNDTFAKSRSTFRRAEGAEKFDIQGAADQTFCDAILRNKGSYGGEGIQEKYSFCKSFTDEQRLAGKNKNIRLE